MKYLLLLFAFTIVVVSLLAPKHVEMIVGAPYTGAYSVNQ